MRLLVTGGAGFIGSNLIHHLFTHADYELIVNVDALTYSGHLANLFGVDHDPRYRFEQADIRDRPALERVFSEHRPDHVIHLAAESHVDRSIVEPDAFIQTNIVGTYHLLDIARAAWKDSPGNHRFVHVSTDEVYGSLGSDGHFSETSPYAPNSPYSASKAASDLLVRSYHRTYGLPAIITNCSNNYGPRQHPEKLVPVVLKSVLGRKSIPLYGDGLNVRDWLFVEDHAATLLRVLERGRIGETYCIGGENEISNLTLAGEICDLVDEMRPDLGGHSRQLISFVADRPGHDRRYAVDIGKIASELHWKPSVLFHEGMRRTIAWYLQNPAFLNR
jgi:dTDP-glucose 4,6-dehydratase